MKSHEESGDKNSSLFVFTPSGPKTEVVVGGVLHIVHNL